MSPSQDDGLGSRVGFRVPSNYATAIEQIANEQNYQAGSHRRVTKSDVARKAFGLYFLLLDRDGKLPEETRDLLDSDLKANAGGEELDVDVDGLLTDPDSREGAEA